MAPPSGRYSTLNAYGLCMGYIWPISTPNIHQMAAHNQITCLLLDIPFISNRNTLRSTLKPAVKDTPHVLLNDRYFWVICCSTRRSCLLASIRACLLASCLVCSSALCVWFIVQQVQAAEANPKSIFQQQCDCRLTHSFFPSLFTSHRTFSGL